MDEQETEERNQSFHGIWFESDSMMYGIKNNTVKSVIHPD
jgi:hypothetical protein